MNRHDLDTYCGLYCGACSILLSYNTGNMDSLAEYFSNELKVGRPQMECCGCKSDKVFFNCRDCSIKACARDKNVEHCIDCKDYPCSMFDEIKKVSTRLPHVKDETKNLERIKAIGVEKWLEEQEQLWKCPECDTTYSWYARKCPNCGQELKNDNVIKSK